MIDFGEAEDGTLFMVMEYLDGKDLGRVLQEEFPLREKRIVGMEPRCSRPSPRPMQRGSSTAT